MFSLRYLSYFISLVLSFLLFSWLFWDESQPTVETNMEMDIAKIGKNVIKSASTGEVISFHQ